MKMKRFFTAALAIVLCMAMLFGMTACKDDKTDNGSQPTDSSQSQPSGTVVEKNIDHVVGKNVIKNGDFENFDTTQMPAKLSDWTIPNRTACSIAENITYNGSGHSICFITNDETIRPYASQTIKNIVPGVTYKISAMVNIVSLYSSKGPSPYHLENAQACFKYSFYDAKGDLVASENFSGLTEPTNGEWVELNDYLAFPEEVESFALWIRLEKAGEIYFDNVTVSIVDDLTLDTNEMFYYSDLETGTATATLSPNPDLACDKVKFSILDGSTELGTVEYAKNAANADVVYQEYTDGSATVKWPFKISTLPQEKKAYTLKATAFDSKGNIISEKTKEIYKYPRPSLMDKNGDIIINGEKFQPGPIYHVNENQYETVKQIGLNVIQSSGTGVTTALNNLDKAYAAGVKVMLILYQNYIPAGHPTNKNNTIEVINAVKNHPALLCYMSMDEPTTQLPIRECEKHLPETYKLIRSLDDKHPVFVVQAEPFLPYMKLAANCSDIVAVDPYPLYNKKNASYQGRHTENAVRAVKDSGKAVWSILQTFAVSNNMTDNKMALPTIDNYRNCYYRSLFAGARGIGIYPFRDAWLKGTNSPLSDYPLWTSMLEFYKGGEVSFANDVFLNGNGKVVNEFENVKFTTKTIEYNGKTYYIVINNTDYTLTNETINLVKADGKTPIGNYTAKQLYGFDEGETGKTISGTDTLKVNMLKEQVFVYEITAN